MKPEAFLDTWETWACKLKSRPVPIHELAGGRSNRSFLLNADGRKMVMRVNAPVKPPGVDRAREARVWQAASFAGLAPPLLHVDPVVGFLVTEYIESDQPDAAHLGDSRLFDLLAAVHALDVDAPSLDYATHIDAYWQSIDSRPDAPAIALERHREPMKALLDEFIASNPATGLCHHDPVRANVIARDERLFLLDWEYAAPGFRAMDYATLSVDWSISDETILERTGIEQPVLDMARRIYRYICDLWEEAKGAFLVAK